MTGTAGVALFIAIPACALAPKPNDLKCESSTGPALLLESSANES